MSESDLASIRTHYDRGSLDVGDLPDEPTDLLARWLSDAIAAGEPEPTAMVVATATPNGVPSTRTVLLKGLDHRGLVFFTNHASIKGRELAANPRCAATLRWDTFHRQVCLQGVAEPVDRSESDAYFKSRPRGARLGAWASRQSEVIADRSVLDRWMAEAEARFPGDDIPLPPFWGGYRIVPSVVDAWQGRPSRLHDRFRYRRTDPAGSGAWAVSRLSP